MDEDSIRKVLGAIAGGTLGAKGGKVSGVSGGIVGAIGGLFAAEVVNAATRATRRSDDVTNVESASAQERQLAQAAAIGMACGVALMDVFLETLNVDLEAGLPKFKDQGEEVAYFKARLPQAQQSFQGSFRWMLEKVAKVMQAEGVSIDVDEVVRELPSFSFDASA